MATTKKTSAAPVFAKIAENKKASFDYFFEERYEAGMVLEGWEVKAIREGKVQLTDGYVVIRNGELFIIGCLINPLKTASTHINPEAARTRKLLLNKEDRAKGLHPGADQFALEIGQGQMRHRLGQGQGRARQTRHHQGP
jgi:SsrA-binding protein